MKSLRSSVGARLFRTFALIFFLTAFSSSQDEVVRRIQTKVSGIEAARGRFEQIGPNGERASGRFWLHRPGRIRFEYDQTSSPTVTSDGVWFVIQEPGMLTQRYPLGSVPLSILLSRSLERLVKDKKVKVEEFKQNGSYFLLRYVSSDIPGSLTLVVRRKDLALDGWITRDIQGLATVVHLRDVDLNAAPKPDGFFIVHDSPLRPFSDRS